MGKIVRIYGNAIRKQLDNYRQMIFLSGARQSGKTTLAKEFADKYLDWDNRNHQQLILKGPDVVAQHCGLLELSESLPVLAFDELHKYPSMEKNTK